MRILKKINNNVGLGVDDKGNEVFVVGSGIGFQKTPYDISADDPKIERIFIASDTVKNTDYLREIPQELIDLSSMLYEQGETILRGKLNPNMVFTLADHIHNAIERGATYSVPNPLQYDIRQIYPEEYKLGEIALETIEKQFNIKLEDSESAFIALHFVNAQFQSDEAGNAQQVTEIIKDIVHLVKYYYKSDFLEDSINFSRFVTHIRYFAIRQLNGAALLNQNESLYQLMVQEHPSAHICVDKIETYLKNNYGWETSNDEKLYLMLHIQRLTSRK